MRKLLTVTLALATLALAGCASDDNKPRNAPSIHIESQNPSNPGARTVVMPQTGLRFTLNAAPVVPEANILATDVCDAGTPELRRKVVRVYVDTPGAKEIYQYSVKARGKRFFLLVDGTPVGVCPIDGPIRNSNNTIFFDVEVPGDTLDKKEAAVFALSNDLNESILKIREEKESK